VAATVIMVFAEHQNARSQKRFVYTKPGLLLKTPVAVVSSPTFIQIVTLWCCLKNTSKMVGGSHFLRERVVQLGTKG